ncbi:hypothetical protein GP486_004524 [Trichoglossum hirsutum]|uniref:Pyridoxamine 5'-phosphate oxidase N-terminal domain-containing protein n=1 Tax=Trichoglossum hirsutum TaxID=265104 RepID=A0A9P8LB79_9PEZI|nr:hypothetical protein GP486_004524 [Trichoglossum hirsutum]
MNYTYLPSSPYSVQPTIVMTTNPASKKTRNLINNPRVSLLVHDWVSHRPPAAADPTGSSQSPSSSSLASLLLNLNTSALSSISATINGVARLVERGTDEEAFYKAKHLENNTFGDRDEHLGGEEDGGRGCFIEGEEVRVVVVKVREGRTADWKGGVRDWRMVGPDEEDNGGHLDGEINGI